MIQGLPTKLTHEATYTDQRLELYFLRHGATVHRRECNILEFIEHVKRWHALPNPAKVLGDDGAMTPWKKLVELLGLLDVDSKKIDLELYNELRACEGTELTAKLLEVQKLQRSGELDQRFKQWEEKQEKIEEKCKDDLYTRWFAHANPLGSHATAKKSANEGDTDQPSAVRQLEEQAEAKVKGWRRGPAAVKRCLNYPAWRYILYIVLIAAAIGGWTFTQMRNKGCGDSCLDNA